MSERIAIVGNSGSGKSYLARSLSLRAGIEVIHLDRLFWMPGSVSEKRSPELVHGEIEERKRRSAWIAEGVFGELINRFLDRVEFLVWLDMPWEVCHAGLITRGSESAQLLDPTKAEESFLQLITWAGNYWKRDDLRSHLGHARIFAGFPLDKMRFDQRAHVDDFLTDFKR